ncbi:MAG: ribosomal protein S18-alanine N-acetyltransferase [Xanthomonadales bacterium]
MSIDPAPLHPLIRQMNADDLDCVVEIERSAYPFPWTRGIFADCIRVGYDCSALQAGPSLIGYTIQSHGAGENHLLNLCVAPQWQRNGYGNLMLNHAIRQARLQQCFSMFLEVRPSNSSGIRLYQQKGFFIVGKRPGYYRSADGREDAIVMRLDI